MKVSKYKKVLLTYTDGEKRTSSVTGDIPLILEEELTLNLESNFDSITQGFDSNLFTALGGLMRDLTGFGFSGQTESMGYQVWKSTSPVSLNLAFSFYLGINGQYDAYSEVYLPMLELMKLPLPSAGPLGILSPPGPSIATLLGGTKEPVLKRTLALSIANILSINNIICTRAEPTWANEFDEKGFPIWGKISLEMQSVMTATVELISNTKKPDPTSYPTPPSNSFVETLD